MSVKTNNLNYHNRPQKYIFFVTYTRKTNFCIPFLFISCFIHTIYRIFFPHGIFSLHQLIDFFIRGFLFPNNHHCLGITYRRYFISILPIHIFHLIINIIGLVKISSHVILTPFKIFKMLIYQILYFSNGKRFVLIITIFRC